MHDSEPPSFRCHGPAMPTSPVILSVPHAGRAYPAALLAALRVPPSALIQLEDRHADYIAQLARRDEILIAADRPRAWIDLNRSERERDPAIDEGVSPQSQPLPSAKLRSGLGLVPRRLATHGLLWSRKFSDAEIRHRIMQDHRPYHQAVADTLKAARERFGVAILLDIHSMPPLGAGTGATRVVLGDRHGAACAPAFLARAAHAVRAGGHVAAINDPYAGGHVLERHGAPGRGVHALQIEIDRSLYLDPALDAPGPGAAKVAQMLRAVIDALADGALPVPVAAE
ncbi:N-formylglutamate amidohydrolase [Stakelama saccharophila]|uniref:N-formylglutamate amidohydrolase n=1 Tax=Stakelama saccharophila TaxID=3075605 RepID=A0ABZ0B7F1_9SPHN|nr:N-formylglutamate amidohydrolase [Stakelama sp. W311]WNO53193.1 N-formylglutamate amidohydrolase [Stakelama sp. W311]